ncbi:unnamed protein product (macronuclear) [Paramecium tetraurelia]|uniref:C2 domain-containing protein n=1 Tax=Paramecium tetraurelia TaxID=5888 RepID=A0BAU2_PARTE|nr:uncharacterized protein GSPATT00000094001 [Paramecium tetraurelia]CAK55659.1 unnamed protein product [Paramecium tetraurelia]|eukprot:XP_001423057.1 hypothetical protein (macronuclear) [Paramecium tetraurelia strain d4-2]
MQQQVLTKDREKIELFFSARGLANKDVLSDSDPQLYVYLTEGKQGAEKLIAKTEVKKNNLNPDWKVSVVLDFIFEVNQYLRFLVVDSDGDDIKDDDIIGTLNTTVGEIMGSRNQVYMGQLSYKNKQTGKLLVKADKRQEIKGSNQVIYWQWYGKKIKNMDGWFGVSDPFLRFFKWHKNSDWLMVHETEFIKDNESPIWKGFEITHDKLHDENPQQPIKIELWDNEKDGKHQLIGSVEVTIEQIFFKEIHEFQVKTPKGEFGGTIGIKSFQKPSFIDYLKGGEQINLQIAIDFTGSNGNPNHQSSLHYNVPNQLNQYQNALSQVAEILLNYDFDKKVPVYGFGGIPSLPNYHKGSTDDCFPLNGNKKDPEVLGLVGIMDAYKHALNHVSLSGPTVFAPVIENAIEIAEKNKKKDIYNVLLIMTDGQIDDMDECVKLVKKAAKLPLSIIIVGVGSANFQKMEDLDGDGPQYQDCLRDVVQFVPFLKFSGKPGDLAKELLSELPDQLIQYKQLIGKGPNPAQQIDLSKLA